MGFGVAPLRSVNLLYNNDILHRTKTFSSQRMNAPVQYSARGNQGILGPSDERKCSLQPRGTTMTKLIISTLAAAIALSSVSSTFAAPKQKVQEPIYFTLATGQE